MGTRARVLDEIPIKKILPIVRQLKVVVVVGGVQAVKPLASAHDGKTGTHQGPPTTIWDGTPHDRHHLDHLQCPPGIVVVLVVRFSPAVSDLRLGQALVALPLVALLAEALDGDLWVVHLLAGAVSGDVLDELVHQGKASEPGIRLDHWGMEATVIE